jgi:DNA-binding winged helix-turn-helix (wHTH) protein
MQAAKRRNGAIELDLGRYELRRDGRRVKLEKKPMEPLIFMVSRREQLVSRRDIVTKLWQLQSFYRYRTKHQQHRAKNPDGSGR